jgi:O-succinylbenzoate synthase
VLPTLAELIATARVVSIPLAVPFRGITSREAMLLHGPQGWTEFSPFVEYDDAEAASWLSAAIEFGWNPAPPALRDSVPVNATVPAVEPNQVADVLARFAGCRTAKVKVAEAGQTLAEDVARVREVRRVLGPEGRIRLDANGAWNMDEAEHAMHAMAEFDLEYVEQPCATIAELAELRTRTHYMDVLIAADESIRKASDPLEVAQAEAADVFVLKAQPLGGPNQVVTLAHAIGKPVVLSSALDTSIGIAMGLFAAAALDELPYDCGLATVALLTDDVTDEPLTPINGKLPVRRPEVSMQRLDRLAASPERTQWWHERLERCYALLASK